MKIQNGHPKIVLELTPREAHALMSALYAIHRNREYLVEAADAPYLRGAQNRLEQRIREYTTGALMPSGRKPTGGG